MEKNLIMLVGCIGSGKSTYAKCFDTSKSVIISQDEQGKNGHKQLFKESIEMGIECIVIDRMNFSKQQRERYIKPAKNAGYVVNVVEFRVCPTVSLRRVVERENHPTIEKNQPDLANKIIKMYHNKYEAPSSDEFDTYNLFKQ